MKPNCEMKFCREFILLFVSNLTLTLRLSQTLFHFDVKGAIYPTLPAL